MLHDSLCMRGGEWESVKLFLGDKFISGADIHSNVILSCTTLPVWENCIRVQVTSKR